MTRLKPSTNKQMCSRDDVDDDNDGSWMEDINELQSRIKISAKEHTRPIRNCNVVALLHCCCRCNCNCYRYWDCHGRALWSHEMCNYDVLKRAFHYETLAVVHNNKLYGLPDVSNDRWYLQQLSPQPSAFSPSPVSSPPPICSSQPLSLLRYEYMECGRPCVTLSCHFPSIPVSLSPSSAETQTDSATFASEWVRRVQQAIFSLPHHHHHQRHITDMSIISIC